MKGFAYTCVPKQCLTTARRDITGYHYLTWSNYHTAGIAIIAVSHLDSNTSEVFLPSAFAEKLGTKNFKDFTKLVKKTQFVVGSEFYDCLCRANGIPIVSQMKSSANLVISLNEISRMWQDKKYNEAIKCCIENTKAIKVNFLAENHYERISL